jgi:hypothetical protein
MKNMFEFPFKTLIAKINEDGTYNAMLTDNTYDKDGREVVTEIPRCQISINILTLKSPDKRLYTIIVPEVK